MASIGIIDYGMGNLHSAAKALEHAAPDSRVFVSGDRKKLAQADRLVLPGVGAVRDCMSALLETGMNELVREQLGKKPLLGICVGMQLLFDSSEENGGTDCLSIVPGEVKRFPSDICEPLGLKIPHMGWNQVAQRQHPMWNGIADGERFYFVHSYYCSPAAPERAAGTTEHGVTATAAISDNQLFAVQFHPEKSAKAGLQLLANFANWNGEPN